MWRWILNILAGTSLVLALAIGGLWVRSYYVADRVGYGWTMPNNGGTVIACWSVWGRCVVWRIRYSEEVVAGLSPGWSVDRYTVGPSDKWPIIGREPNGRLSLFGLSWEAVDPSPDSSFRGLFVPHWFLITMAGVAPALWLRRRRRERTLAHRRAAGLCLHCGYDLRASPVRCPECGTPTPAKSAVH